MPPQFSVGAHHFYLVIRCDPQTGEELFGYAMKNEGSRTLYLTPSSTKRFASDYPAMPRIRVHAMQVNLRLQADKKLGTSEISVLEANSEWLLGYMVLPATPQMMQLGISSYLAAPCGCHSCDTGVLPQHLDCDVLEPELLTAESDGAIARVQVNGVWVFYPV